jgi:hypothetical protein
MTDEPGVAIELVMRANNGLAGKMNSGASST